MQTIKIGTRKSLLALWQSEFVKSQLKKLDANLTIDLVKFTTKGDKLLDSPLAKIGGKGLFVKELEDALLQKSTDLAVHSLKDVPMDLPQGLDLASVLKRHSPFDAFVSNNYSSIKQMEAGALVGTSSLRRKIQLKRAYPHLEFADLRGNIHTRLAKLDAQEYAAIILAESGLRRMGFDERIKEVLAEDICLPACGQGALAIEIRSEDTTLRKLLEKLTCKKTLLEVTAERAFNRALSGGCQVPIAAFARVLDTKINLKTRLLSLDGTRIFSADLSADFIGHFESVENLTENLAIAADLGDLSAKNFLSQGADEVLAEIFAQG